MLIKNSIYMLSVAVIGFAYIGESKAGCIRNNTVANIHVYTQVKGQKFKTKISPAGDHHVEDNLFPMKIKGGPTLHKHGCYDISYSAFGWSAVRGGACC